MLNEKLNSVVARVREDIASFEGAANADAEMLCKAVVLMSAALHRIDSLDGAPERNDAFDQAINRLMWTGQIARTTLTELL